MTTVVTPQKCSGRNAPSQRLDSPVTSTRVLIGGVNRHRLRVKNEAHTRLAAQLDIVLERPWILVEILFRTELRRVDEDRHDNELPLATCLFHQADMATMESAHRRYESNARSALTRQIHGLAHFTNLFDNLQIHDTQRFLCTVMLGDFLKSTAGQGHCFKHLWVEQIP
jgi:hypothetical protein